ncbi:MAG: DUF6443 domain-containing protein [Cyclobacteriaceae bacterium]
MNTTTYIIVFLVAISTVAGIAQPVEVVSSKVLSVSSVTSYVYSVEVKLAPGFTASAQTDGEFFCRHENYQNQILSLTSNLVRIEHAIGATTSDATFSTFNNTQKQITYQYFDGAGRPVQSIAVKGSPGAKDAVVFSAYETDGWQTKGYLPHVTSKTTNGSLAADVLNDQALFYTNTPKTANDIRPFSEHTLIEKSALGRVKEAYGPGNAWYSAHHKSTSLFSVNTSAVPVKRWQISESTGLPFSNSNYPDGTVSISKGSDEEGSQSSSMTDFRGNTVQTTIHGSPELITYYVYDHFGRLRFTIPPEASGNLSPDQTFIDKWAFQYVYDARGRLVKEKRPGTDWQYYIYDQWDRMVLSQDGNQRAKIPKEWNFVKYDALNRPVMTGIITSNNNFDQMVAAVTGGHHETRNTSAVGYTLSNSFPSVTESNILTISYYDDYGFVGNAGWDAEGNNFSFQSDPLFPEPQFTAVKTLPTGSKVKLLGQNTWLNLVVYYDKKYRPIQSVEEHHLGGIDRSFTEYNFPGWVLKTKRVHNSTLGSATILEEYDYDHGGRLTKHYHTIDNGTRTLLAANNYNELGQLVEVNTHSTDEINFLQSTDYRYNIRGWLTHINNSTLTNDGVNNDDTNDLFGMQIIYYDETQTVNGVNTNPRYNGLISAIKWKTDNKKDPPQERIYGHYYTPDVNQLSQSLYAAKGGSSWTAEPGFYDLTNLTYDKNGNIQTLNRYAKANNTRITLDQLTYGYGSNGNKLTNVEDAGNPSFGFKNGTVGIPTEYDYDPGGNLVSDLNKEIIEVRYNYLNLPDYIEFYDGWKLEYTYDATGYAVKKVLKKGNTIVRQVDYAHGIQYFDNALTLIFTAKGRAVKQNNTYDYEYFLTDHLGNTRVVYGYLRDTDVFKATMETGNASTEEIDFKNIPSSRYQDPLYNHTPKTLDIPVPDRSAITNGYLGKAIGPAKMLQVSAGDKITLEVFARYTTSTSGNNTVINNLVAAVTGAYGIVNAGETQTAYQALNNNLPGTSALIPTATNVPKAYLYYIIFNSSYVYQQFGYFSVPFEAALGHVPLKLEVNVPVNGFLYTYVANESNVSSATSVFFDDFTIIHEKNTYSLRVVESIDYDPFGVVLEGTYYVDVSRPLNSYLYQGEFAEFESLTGWNRFALRANYDATLGRWFSEDPYDQFTSTYIGMGNDFINGADPDGGLFFSLGGAFAGALIGGAVGGLAGYFFDRDNWQKWALTGALAVGLYTGFTMDPLTYSPVYVKGFTKFGAQFKQVFSGNSGYIMEGYRRIGYHTYGRKNTDPIQWLDEIVVVGRSTHVPDLSPRRPKPLVESIPITPRIVPVNIPRPKPILRPLVANINQFGVISGQNVTFQDGVNYFKRAREDLLIEWLKDHHEEVEEIIIELDRGTTGSENEVRSAIEHIRNTLRTWRIPSGKIKIRRLRGSGRGSIRVIPYGR